MPNGTQTVDFDALAQKHGGVIAASSLDDLAKKYGGTAVQAQATPPNEFNQTLSKATGIRAQPKPFTKEWFKQGLWRAGASTADVAPAAGATIGAMVGSEGGPAGAIGGAGMGGAGGAGLQQLMRRALGYPNVPQTGGEAAQDITKQGVTQAGIQAATEVLPGLAGPLKRAATTQYERALAPTTQINKEITKDIVPGLLKRGEVGSLEGLEKKATQKIAEINPKLSTAYGKAQGTGPIQDAGTKVIADLEKLKQTYMPQGVVAQPQAVNAIEGLQDIVKQYGPDVSPNTLRRLRQIFEDPVAKAGGYAGKDLSTNYTLAAQQKAADSIRGILNKAPDIGALNKEISFWLDVQRVTSQSALRRTGQAGGLVKVLSPLAGSVGLATGVATHSSTAGIEAGVIATLTGLTAQAIRSPLWRTTSAVVKSKIADALARGSVGDLMALTARFGGAAMESKQSPQQSGPPTQ